MTKYIRRVAQFKTKVYSSKRHSKEYNYGALVIHKKELTKYIGKTVIVRVFLIDTNQT